MILHTFNKLSILEIITQDIKYSEMVRLEKLHGNKIIQEYKKCNKKSVDVIKIIFQTRYLSKAFIAKYRMQF